MQALQLARWSVMKIHPVRGTTGERQGPCRCCSPSMGLPGAAAWGKSVQKHDGESRLVHKATEIAALFLDDQTERAICITQIQFTFWGISLKYGWWTMCALSGKTVRQGVSLAGAAAEARYVSTLVLQIHCFRPPPYPSTGSSGDASWWWPRALPVHRVRNPPSDIWHGLPKLQADSQALQCPGAPLRGTQGCERSAGLGQDDRAAQRATVLQSCFFIKIPFCRAATSDSGFWKPAPASVKS